MIELRGAGNSIHELNPNFHSLTACDKMLIDVVVLEERVHGTPDSVTPA
jgi:hypothetical protein